MSSTPNAQHFVLSIDTRGASISSTVSWTCFFLSFEQFTNVFRFSHNDRVSCGWSRTAKRTDSHVPKNKIIVKKKRRNKRKFDGRANDTTEKREKALTQTQASDANETRNIEQNVKCVFPSASISTAVRPQEMTTFILLLAVMLPRPLHHLLQMLVAVASAATLCVYVFILFPSMCFFSYFPVATTTTTIMFLIFHVVCLLSCVLLIIFSHLFSSLATLEMFGHSTWQYSRAECSGWIPSIQRLIPY